MLQRTVLTFIAFAFVSAAAAQAPPTSEKPSAKSRSLDQQLLDDIDRQLLEGLPGAKKSDPTKNARAASDSQPATAKSKGALPDATDNPLARIAQRMRTVQSRIASRDTSAATQEEQQQIVQDLTALLDQKRRPPAEGGNPASGGTRGAAQAGAGSGNPVPGPARDSTNRIERGNIEQPQTPDVKDLFRRIWGHLPDKLREEMQASLSEQFLPKYERLIEQYYQRLAEEDSGRP